MALGLARCWWGVALTLIACAATAQPGPFPRPAGLEPDIAFWRRVYTEIDTSSGFIHDSANLAVVYRTVHFPEDVSRRQRNRELRAAYDEIRGALERLADGKREGLAEQERRVLDAWPADVSNAELRAGMTRLRFQLGQSDRFHGGLVRAGIWKPYIESVLERRGLPIELASLPHVESSFDPTAYSKVGAAGMWQFTRSTGLRYMRIDHIVDERRDPFFATVAAARLLQNNFDVLGSWPLALTAYNHGVAGMRQAVQQQGTADIETIVRQYKGRTFGFASRNFYVAFLAALDIDRDPERYFGPLSPNPSAQTITVSVPDFVTVDALADALDVDVGALRYWNPALTEAVWSRDKFVPRGFELRLPAALGADPAVRLAAIPATSRYTAQMPDIYHRVGRGDTISGIATRYGVSMASLVELNGLRSRNFIRAGQVLRLPGNGATTPVTLADSAGGGAVDSSTYIVRAGDSVARIARRFGVSEDVLLARNGITDRNRIYAGQALQLDRVDDGELAFADSVTTVSVESAATGESLEPVETIEAVETSESQAAVVATPTSAARPETILTVAVAPASRSLADEKRLFAAEAALATIMESGVDGVVVGADETATFSEAAIVDAAGPVADTVNDAAGAEETAGEPNALGSEQAELAADPSDYLVAADLTIEVQALETLGHYADWLGIPTQRLRDINGLPFGQAVVIGERLKLEFDGLDVSTFEQLRVDYQRSAQEAFFLSYQITDTVDHTIEPGESLWVLAQRRYRVPVWLVRQFNPDLHLDQISPGTVVKFPALRPISEPTPQARAAN